MMVQLLRIVPQLTVEATLMRCNGRVNDLADTGQPVCPELIGFERSQYDNCRLVQSP